MEINGKLIIYGILITIILLLLLVSIGIINLNFSKATGNAANGNNMPEKCKVPAGTDVNSWKEHLGHHAETQDCLKYFN